MFSQLDYSILYDKRERKQPQRLGLLHPQIKKQEKTQPSKTKKQPKYIKKSSLQTPNIKINQKNQNNHKKSSTGTVQINNQDNLIKKSQESVEQKQEQSLNLIQKNQNQKKQILKENSQIQINNKTQSEEQEEVLQHASSEKNGKHEKEEETTKNLVKQELQEKQYITKDKEQIQVQDDVEVEVEDEVEIEREEFQEDDEPEFKPNNNYKPVLRKRKKKKKKQFNFQENQIRPKNNKQNQQNQNPTQQNLQSLNKIFKKTNNLHQAQLKNFSVKKNQSDIIDTQELFKNYYIENYITPKNQEGTQIENDENNILIKQSLSDYQSKANMVKLQEKLIELHKKNTPSTSYINCDLKYFNFDYLIQNFGCFDIILMDPPWRIKGGQGNDSQFMFSNSKFTLEYNTMSNQEIMDLKVEKLSKNGFLFVWILNTQMNLAYEMMQKWGYEVIDQIVWVKLKDGKVYLTHGYYFMHSFEVCLVGMKNTDKSVPLEYHSKVSNNVIFSEVRKKSQKPDELYELIELIMPGSKKIELFARNNNLRPGWFSLGNQLGDTYEKWTQKITCNYCQSNLTPGNVRLKSKKIPDFDICEKCLEQKSESLNKDDFYRIINKVNEDVLHFYHKCDKCGNEPIWGVRFECNECNTDLCESCLDQNIQAQEKFHNISHDMKVVEVPLYAHGFPVHSQKYCQCCKQRPIIGVCFTCKQCSNYNLCQQCFFSKTPQELCEQKGRHKIDHRMESIFEPQDQSIKIKYKCNGCLIDSIQGDVYKCQNCFMFYFCEKCFISQGENFNTNYATSHKNYHQFLKIQVKEI